MVALRRGQHRAAAQHLERAVTRGASKRSTLYLLLARSRFQLGDKRGALTALDAAGAGAERFPGAYLLRAQCHWRLGEHPAAWRALAAGAARHPASREIMQQRVFLLIDLGLYRTATEEGLRYLRGGEAALDDHVAIAQALARAKQHQRAALILEQARLRHPGSRKVTIQLARTYLDAGTPLAAAQILHHASLRFPKLAIEAAELYRRAGKLLRALHLNAQVTDQARKIRQRLGLLVELERFEQAAALQPRLSRLGLLADDNICYALAFSYYRTGRHDEAERLLRRLRDPAAVERAGALRRAMAACAERGWECR
jgi:predicted Zn-dependent protease